MEHLNSLVGMAVLLILAILMSTKRKAINWRTVSVAFAIQLTFGVVCLYLPEGRDILEKVSGGVQSMLNYGQEGISFLFGGLVSGKMFELFGGGGFVFALRVLPMIVFFSALISVLYYLGVMGFVTRSLGGLLHKALGTSRAESVSAAANIFVSLTDAPLLVKPYVSKMTQSELFALMTCGFASIAGSVLAGYASMGIPLPYLIAASFMAAPSGLLFAKLIVPETETVQEIPKDKITFTGEGENPPTNVIDAAAMGASTGMHMALSVGAMLVAFVALMALLNGLTGYVGSWFGIEGLSLQKILGWLFAPLAWLIGATWEEAQIAGSFLGQKLILNEFVAYVEYSKYLASPEAMVLTEKTKAIIVFALCGFANFGSIAILVGGLTIIAPSRRGDIVRLGMRSLFAATLANLMSATIAGMFIGMGSGNLI